MLLHEAEVWDSAYHLLVNAQADARWFVRKIGIAGRDRALKSFHAGDQHRQSTRSLHDTEG